MTPANEMELKFDSRSANEGFARVAVAAFMTQLNPIHQPSEGCRYAGAAGL